MAHIFKKHTKDSKGIIVYTHKEIGHSRWLDKVDSLPILGDEIAEKYFIGINKAGAPEPFYNVHKNISFFMSSPGQVRFFGRQPMLIPFNSRSFLPEFFKPRGQEKYWDIINVSRNDPVKHLDVFLQAVRSLYDSGKMYRVLLVVPSEDDELKEGSPFPKIVEYYENNFSMKEKEYFTMIKLTPEFSGQGLSMRTIAHFYNSSKVFCMLSHAEGESRVIHEALVSGLPVVCFSKLVGGGRDFLNSQNSVQFDDYSRLPEALSVAVDNWDKDLHVDVEEVSKLLSSSKTIPALKKYFKQLYSHHGEVFSDEESLLNTDYLNLRLPGHYLNVPWYDRDVYKYGADIYTIKQFNALKRELGL